MKRILLLLTAVLAAGIMTFPIIGAAITTGDGYLLKRSIEETCHACHKTDQNRTGSSPDWADAIKTHNANRFGTCTVSAFSGTSQAECEAATGTWTPSTKWGANWGLPGGKYGEIGCTTCHTAHDTRNIYLTKETITAPNSPTDNLPGSTVDFRYKEAYDPGNPKDGTMGRDNEARTSSSRVCEVCHSYDNTGTNGVKYHAYNMPAVTHYFPKKHSGSQVCIQCHSHKNSFTDDCDICHSPGGSFNGVISVGGSIGARDNWGSGVYHADNTLMVGKEKWCAGCHDNAPSVVNGKAAPDIVGDNTTYGYYLDAHGNETEGVNRQGVIYSQGECVHCHDVSIANTAPVPRIIDESFEKNPGYDESGWTEPAGNPDEDSTLPTCTPPACSPPPGAGYQCLQSISASPGYEAYAIRDYGSEQPRTFTRFYLYVDNIVLNDGQFKTIGALRNSTNSNVFVFRLNQNAGQLRFNLRVYNNGGWTNYYAGISSNTWYKIEVKYNNINNTWAWRLDGATKNYGRLTGTHLTGIQKWGFGFWVSTETIPGTIYFDLIAVKNDDWLGEEQSATGIPFHGGQLFAENNPSSQTDNFCFQCHRGTGSVQVGGITNYTYSKNFGGGSQTFTTIYDAFNPTTGATPSSHNLSDVLNHAGSRDSGFTDNTNACIVCHDPHVSQRNYPVTLSGKGGVYTAIRRTADYADNPTNLWGDDVNERMKDYTNKYQAPYFVGGAPNNYEPADNNVADGSNLPHYVGFCMTECHVRSDVYSTTYGRNLLNLNWDSTGDHHGRNWDSGTSGLGATIAPYGNASTNYVLSCTDCHEPHGSQNEWLLRTTVNGTNVSVPGPYQWLNFCKACHTINQHTAPWGPTTNCYNAGVCHAHGKPTMF